jgi:L-alanine-DL-glutamate epimerase-like enolase superfamily enzyme
MRISKVTPISVAYPEPNDNGSTRHLTLCRVETEDGTVGWGESVTMWPAVCRAVEDLIRGYAELVVGRHVEDNVAVWQAMRDHGWWYGHGGGFVSFAISAIDIALWDVRGKVTGQSLVAMLGGARRPDLPVIASTHAFRSPLEREVEVHAGYVADGYHGVKVGLGKRGDARLGYEIERDVTFARRYRESVGPDAWLMFDRGQSLPWDVEHAVRLTRGLEEHGLRWMEEPFEPHETSNYRTYRDRVSTMIGAGEREWDEHGYRRVIESGLLDVIGFDPGRAQGITGGMNVIRLVEEAGLWFNAHAWSSAIVTSASIALSTITDRSLLFELKPMENPMQHELVDEPFTHDRGRIGPRSSPGLGIEVDQSVVDRYRFD